MGPLLTAVPYLPMKKIIISALCIAVFSAYAIYRHAGNAAPTSIASSGPQTTGTPTSLPAPATKPQGQYADGAYTGIAANAFYGYVQVKALVQNGKLADVQFLQYPNDRSTSRFINSQAMPLLTQEAIQAQSANVDGVSGASDTSAAFQQSLASALSKAKA